MALAADPTGPARVLVLRALGLGDLLTAVPALRAVRGGWPAAEVVLAIPGPLAPLALLTGAVDRVLATRGLQRLPWTGRPPYVAVDLHGRGPQSHRLLQDLRPDRLLAYANPEVAWADGPDWEVDEHEVSRWCRLLACAGVPCPTADLDLAHPGPPSSAPGAVLVHPGAAAVARRWPAQRFAGVARSLAGDGHRVVVTGAAAERDLAVAVAAEAGLDPTAVLAGRTGPLELAALVAEAGLVLCGDTGVAHLATAYRTPSVLLFGPTSPLRWGPPPDRPYHRVLWRGTGDGDPHGSEPDPALLALTVTDVLAAARETLSGDTGAPRGGAGG